ncbi:MAG: hypothetical protein R3F59_37675 [Myxococcota bacterium]
MAEGYTRADADKVDDLVTGLLNVRYDALQEPPPEIADPAYTVTVALDDGTAAQLEGDAIPTGEEALSGTSTVTASDGRGGTLPPMRSRCCARADRSRLAHRLRHRPRAGRHRHVRLAGLRGGGVAQWRRLGGRRPRRRQGLRRDRRAGPDEDPLPAHPAGAAGSRAHRDGGGGDRHWTVAVGPPLPDGTRVARNAGGGAPFLVEGEPFDAALDDLAPPGG